MRSRKCSPDRNLFMSSGLKDWITSVPLVLMVLLGYTQQSKVTFDTYPQNAKLILDGEELGAAHRRSVRIGFNERKGITKHTFIVKAAGYDDAQVVFDLETPQTKMSFVRLQRSVPELDFESDVTFAFDQVYSAIPYSTNVGNNTKWKYKYDQAVTIGDERDRLIESMERMELPMPNAGDSARVIIRGRVEDLEIRKGRGVDSYSPYSDYYTIRNTIQWEFFDTKTGDTLVVNTRTSSYEFNTGAITDAFHASIVDNFLLLCSDDPALERDLKELDQAMIEEVRRLEEEARAAELAKQQAVLDSIARVESSEDIGAPLEIDSTAEAMRPVQTLRLVRPAMPALDGARAVEIFTRKAVVTVSINEGAQVFGGTVISADGYIVTHHLDSNAGKIEVQFSNGILLPASVEQVSENHGMALIKVNAVGLKAIPIAEDLSAVQRGDAVITWESAALRSLEADATPGELVGRKDTEGVQRMLTSIPREAFTPGSGLLDQQGRMIGVMTENQNASTGRMGVATDARYIYHVFGIKYE